MSKPTLLITGINGFIGAWVVKFALESKKYNVYGTVRNHTDKEKIEPLKKALGELFDELTLVSMDLEKDETVVKACENMEYILHVASPFPVESPKNEDEVIKPAVNGTLSVLKAVTGTKTKRVIITSSVAAIMDHTKGDIKVDETNWPSNADELTPYYKSKIQAEKAAWKYWKELKEDQRFELVTLNPGVVTGKLLTKAGGGSVKIFEMIMKGDLWSIPQVYFPTVDVKDVAHAHIIALTKAKSGERYAITAGTYFMPDLGQLMSDEFTQYGYKVTTGTMCKFTAWMASFVNTDAAGFYNDWFVN
jgi:nucleoside-diphosphate-sugar epimerase